VSKPYLSYKDSGVDWIGKIPKEWKIKKIKYFYSIIGGNGFNESLQGQNSGDYPFCKVSDINHPGAFIESAKNFVSQEDVISNKYNIIPIGSLIFAKIGEALKKNHRKINKVKCIIDNNTQALIPNKEIDNIFSYYLFMCIDMNWFNKDGTIPCINNQKLLDFFIPDIPMDKQKKIVKYLDYKTSLIDKLIEKTKKKIELLKEKRTSLINHSVTKGLNPDVEMKDSGIDFIGEVPQHWKIQKGSTIGQYSKGKGIGKDEVKENGLPCIRYGEIYTIYNRIVYSTRSFISEDENNNRVKVSKGAVLLTGSGETFEDIGKSIVYMGEEAYVGGDIIIIKLKKDIQPLFFSYLINSESIRNQKAMLGRGDIIVHIYPKNLREMSFCIPPISEQIQITNFLDEYTQKIDTIIEKENRRINLLKEYRKSLISEVVTGKIDVQDEVVA